MKELAVQAGPIKGRHCSDNPIDFAGCSVIVSSGQAPKQNSVGAALLDEIERVSAKRERWNLYQRDMGPEGRCMEIGIALMAQSIDAAKEALQSDDPARALATLEDLRGFDSDD